jgi:hypothetical protein
MGDVSEVEEARVKTSRNLNFLPVRSGDKLSGRANPDRVIHRKFKLHSLHTVTREREEKERKGGAGTQ